VFCITNNIHMSVSVLLIMSIVLEEKKKPRRENQNTFFYPIIFFFENRTVYEIKWKNIVQPDRPQITIWHMRIACWIPKVTYTHSEYVIILLFHYNNCITNAPQYYVLRIPPCCLPLTNITLTSHSLCYFCTSCSV